MFHPTTGFPLPLGLVGGAAPVRLAVKDFRSKATVPIVYPEAFDVTQGLPFDTCDLGNTDNGDCGVAGPGHQVTWMDARAGRPARVTTDGILAAYQAITGGPDVGVTAEQVLTYWRNTGICGCKITADLAVDYNNQEEVTAAASELGGIHLMFTLPKCVQGKTTWDVPAGDDGGVWGGHWVWAFAAGGGLSVNSWGQPIFVTWPFVAKYAFDARVVVTPDDLDGTGQSFLGLDMAGLNAAIAALKE